MFRALVVCGCLAACLAAPQRQQFQPTGRPAARATTTPVPILRQISNSNDDGSYTYGYEAADGSFKLETRKANGEVFGKYGYVDANGELITIEYGANKLGFQPSGKGITVAPPTLIDESSQDYIDDEPSAPAPAPVRRPAPVRQAAPAPAPVRQPAPAPVRIAAPPAPVRQAPAASPIGQQEFESRFADFDARIASLFSRA